MYVSATNGVSELAMEEPILIAAIESKFVSLILLVMIAILDNVQV